MVIAEAEIVEVLAERANRPSTASSMLSMVRAMVLWTPWGAGDG